MKKTLLCLLLCLLLPFSALAARMPANGGTVTDDANVLSAQLILDVTDYAKQVEKATGIELHFVVVHFLDGMDAQSYANELFAKWKLGKDALLVVIAAGEDSCATAMGEKTAEKLGRSNAENLMYTSSDFSAHIRAQRYDEAVSVYCQALNRLIEKQQGETIRTGGMFGAQTEQTPQAYSSDSWGEMRITLDDSGTKAQQRWDKEEEQSNGLTAGGWIVLIILAVILFRKKGAPGQSRRGCGCGCSPIGWLCDLLGIGRR